MDLRRPPNVQKIPETATQLIDPRTFFELQHVSLEHLT
jgi:hypothetical protein